MAFMLAFAVVAALMGYVVARVVDEIRLRRALNAVRAHKKRVGPKTHPSRWY